MDSFSKFMHGVLRHTGADAFALQLHVERLVWENVRHDYDDLTCRKVDVKSVLFRLFAIFNRFCSTDSMPMLLSSRACLFLTDKLRVPPMSTDDDVDLTAFLQHVVRCRDKLSIGALKSVYDMYVRDVIKEGRVFGRGSANSAHKSRNCTVMITSRHIVVYKDDEELDVHLFEAEENILYRLEHINTQTTREKSFFGKELWLRVINIATSQPVIELCFDALSSQSDIHEWSQALEEAAFNAQANTDRLTKEWLRLGLFTMHRSQSEVTLYPLAGAGRVHKVASSVQLSISDSERPNDVGHAHLDTSGDQTTAPNAEEMSTVRVEVEVHSQRLSTEDSEEDSLR